MTKRTHVDGLPYLCTICGGYYDDDCPAPYCQLESEFDAAERHERFRAGITKSIATRQSVAYHGRSRKPKEVS